VYAAVDGMMPRAVPARNGASRASVRPAAKFRPLKGTNASIRSWKKTRTVCPGDEKSGSRRSRLPKSERAASRAR
jgi:hypothetical protein